MVCKNLLEVVEAKRGLEDVVLKQLEDNVFTDGAICGSRHCSCGSE